MMSGLRSAPSPPFTCSTFGQIDHTGTEPAIPDTARVSRRASVFLVIASFSCELSNQWRTSPTEVRSGATPKVRAGLALDAR